MIPKSIHSIACVRRLQITPKIARINSPLVCNSGNPVDQFERLHVKPSVFPLLKQFLLQDWDEIKWELSRQHIVSKILSRVLSFLRRLKVSEKTFQPSNLQREWKFQIVVEHCIFVLQNYFSTKLTSCLRVGGDRWYTYHIVVNKGKQTARHATVKQLFFHWLYLNTGLFHQIITNTIKN